MSRIVLQLASCGVVALGLIWGVNKSALPIHSLSAAPATVAAIQPLDRVPADAALIIHFEAKDLWNHEVIAAFRKTNPEFVKGLLEEPIKNSGIEPENVKSITLHYPKMPTGPGEEELFILQVTTKKPYNQQNIFNKARKGNTKPEGEFVELMTSNYLGDRVELVSSKLKLHFTTDKQFTILHSDLVEKFQKGASTVLRGSQEETLKLARSGKNHITLGADPRQLPNELLTATPPPFQSFLPLLKVNCILVSGKIDSNLGINLAFLAESENKAIDAERSLSQLLKLAETGIESSIKKLTPTNPENENFHALLKRLQAGLQQVTPKRSDNTVTATFSLKLDSALVPKLR